ncbi:MAG: 23S rRNA (adenine(2503)-C(2))-methyltransferase RlmN [Phycisphaerae bacterium]
MKHILDMTPGHLEAEFEAMGEKPFRARQILKWIYEKGVTDFDKMSDLPARLREKLPEQFTVLSGKVVDRVESADNTLKLLLEFPDGERVETVLIPTGKRATACLSTQAGCSMKCTFCATGIGGFRRNLTAGEIVEQAIQLWAESGTRITHAVYMGMGEPLMNFNATVKSLHALVDEKRLGISARRVTVSTIGFPKKIRRLMEEDLPITLAISLHAPNDPLRQQLIPAAKNTKLEDILEAADDFFRYRGREVTLEYTLISGVNDTGVCADALVKIAQQLRCKVNLIRYNPVESLEYAPPSMKTVKDFEKRLAGHGVKVSVRRSRGIETDAACGQLRRRTT